VLSQPAPNVRLMAFGANAIEFEIRFWITDPEEGVSGARSEVLKRVWHLFKEHSIELPFPQLDLYLRDSKAFQQLAAAIAHRDAGSDEA
jgi:small-conductance mechanosensitive channel